MSEFWHGYIWGVATVFIIVAIIGFLSPILMLIFLDKFTIG